MTRCFTAATLAALLVHGAAAQFCPVGRPTPGCPAALSITEVEFRDSFDTAESSYSGCDPSGYEAPWGLGSSIFGSGHGAPITVTVAVAGLLPTDGVTLWLDWNQNQTFDANEAFPTTIVPAFGGAWKAVGTLTTPACSPQTGLARVRVAAVRGQPYPQPACGFYADGDWEDYDFAMYPGIGLGAACPTILSLGQNGAAMTYDTGAWVSFTPPATGGYSLNSFDVANGLAGLYESVGGALVPSAGVSASGGNLALYLLGGHTYVLHYQNLFNPGGMSINVAALPASPPNDSCVGATPVGLGTTAGNALAAATFELGAQAPCEVFRDLWFTFVAPAPGAYSFAATQAVGYPPFAVNVYSACGGVALACGAGAATAELAGGQTCVLRIGDPRQAQNWPSPFVAFDLHVAATTGPTTTLAVAPGALSLAISGAPPYTAYFFAVTLNQGTFPNGPFFGIEPDWNDLWLQFNAGAPFRGNLDGGGTAAHGPFFGIPPGLTFYAVTVTNIFGPIPAATAPVSATTV